MKNLVILGAGTAGTMMANHLEKKLDKRNWRITVIDRDTKHYYQPGFLFIPFQVYSEKDVIRDKRSFLPSNCKFILSGIETINASTNNVKLENGQTISYDVLIIATGSKIVPEAVEGLLGDGWRKNIFDFYTIEGATALREAFKSFKEGKLVIHLTEMPIKCPVAPLEFNFLVDWWLNKVGIRNDVELTYVTPLPGAFTKQNCSRVLGYLIDQKNIRMVTDYTLERIDSEKQSLISFDERRIEYDLLVTIPTNMGDQLIERSGLGDELNFIPTDKHTLQSRAYENVFVLGDATDLPSSKAGSVAHFQSEILTQNIINFISKKPLLPEFDGHANCFIESGFGKAFLIDFNYDIEPVEGKFPIPGIGPFSLLKETRINHLGKLAFKWTYWNMLLKARPMPGISTKMTTVGKKLPERCTAKWFSSHHTSPPESRRYSYQVTLSALSGRPA
jgi:sulfide:quinone oxidoreductase